MDKLITKEQYAKLKPYHTHLQTAYYNDYVRGAYSTTRNALADIYMNIFGEEPNGLRNGCNHCIISSLKRLATEYFKYRKRYGIDKQNKEQ